jgi:hypothetical protein
LAPVNTTPAHPIVPQRVPPGRGWSQHAQRQAFGKSVPARAVLFARALAAAARHERARLTAPLAGRSRAAPPAGPAWLPASPAAACVRARASGQERPPSVRASACVALTRRRATHPLHHERRVRLHAHAQHRRQRYIVLRRQRHAKALRALHGAHERCAHTCRVRSALPPSRRAHHWLHECAAVVAAVRRAARVFRPRRRRAAFVSSCRLFSLCPGYPATSCRGEKRGREREPLSTRLAARGSCGGFPFSAGSLTIEHMCARSASTYLRYDFVVLCVRCCAPASTPAHRRSYSC